MSVTLDGSVIEPDLKFKTRVSNSVGVAEFDADIGAIRPHFDIALGAIATEEGFARGFVVNSYISIIIVA